jgi:hypothetical protein
MPQCRAVAQSATVKSFSPPPCRLTLAFALCLPLAQLYWVTFRYRHQPGVGRLPCSRSRVPLMSSAHTSGSGFILHQLIPPLFLLAAPFFLYLQYPQRVFGLILLPGLRAIPADFDGGFENGPDGKYSSQFVRGHGGQTHGCHASAGSAIRIPSKLAWSDLGLQVCRQRVGRERENAILGAVWRRGKLPNHRLWHVQFRIFLSQLRHFHYGPRPFFKTQHFRHSISHLRSEQAEPYLLDLGARRPKFQECLQVSWPLHHLTCNRAVNGDPLPHDVSQNTVIRCRCPPEIVFRLQPVDGHDYVQSLQAGPGRTHCSESAGYDLHVDSARQQGGNQQLQFAIADQRVASDDRQVQRLQPINDLKNPFHQGLASSIVQVAQRLSAA